MKKMPTLFERQFENHKNEKVKELRNLQRFIGFIIVFIILANEQYEIELSYSNEKINKIQYQNKLVNAIQIINIEKKKFAKKNI